MGNEWLIMPTLTKKNIFLIPSLHLASSVAEGAEVDAALMIALQKWWKSSFRSEDI